MSPGGNAKGGSPPPCGEGVGGGGKRPQAAYPKANLAAKRLRREMSATEKLLWKHLKSSAFGDDAGHFRKQAPIGPYVADFVHHRARVIIELDGTHHDLPGRAERDAGRTAWLTAQGYRVIRFRNEEVWKRLPDVVAAIAAMIPPPPGPLPTRGRGNAPMPPELKKPDQ